MLTGKLEKIDHEDAFFFQFPKGKQSDSFLEILSKKNDPNNNKIHYRKLS